MSFLCHILRHKSGKGNFGFIFQESPETEVDTFQAASVHRVAAGKDGTLYLVTPLKKHRFLIPRFLPSEYIDGRYFANRVRI